jgi:phosphoglycolate phosphatase
LTDALEAVRCIVFDFDGTLAESNAIKRGTYYEIFAGFPEGAETLDRVLRENPRADRHGVVAATREALTARGQSPPPAKELVAAYARITEERVSTCAAVPGALAALTELHGALPMYIASATPEEPLRRIVENRAWTHFFSDVLGGPRTKVENLGDIAARESLEPNGVLLVGDGPPDLDAARAFGCPFAGFQTERPSLSRDPQLAVLAPLARELYLRSQEPESA